MCKLGGGGYFKYKISKGAYSNMYDIQHSHHTLDGRGSGHTCFRGGKHCNSCS